MSQHKPSSSPKLNNVVAIGELLLLLVMLPAGTGYIGTAIFGLSVLPSVLLGLASLLVIFFSLVALLGATIRFPDHLPTHENGPTKLDKSDQGDYSSGR